MTTPTVPELLRAAAATYEERNAVYKDNYKRIGAIFCEMFPEGLSVNTPEEWNRLFLLVQSVSKVTRYASQFSFGGHLDSVHDAIVYSAMLEELTLGEKR